MFVLYFNDYPIKCTIKTFVNIPEGLPHNFELGVFDLDKFIVVVHASRCYLNQFFKFRWSVPILLLNLLAFLNLRFQFFVFDWDLTIFVILGFEGSFFTCIQEFRRVITIYWRIRYHI